MATYRHQGKWNWEFWKNKIRQRGSGYPTKREAKTAEAEARKRLKMMNSDFISLCEGRLRDLKERRTEKYFKENKSLIKKLILIWGNKKEITRKDVEDYLSTRASKSHTLANRELRMIKALFGYGTERELLNSNPAERIKVYSVDKSRKYIPPFQDIAKALEKVTPRNRLYLLAIINSMARVSEMNKLKWDDVHEDFIILRTKKSKNSDTTERKIPMNETLKEVIDSTPKISAYVFCYKATGKRYGYRRKMLLRACKKAGVKPFGYHALRHYGASKLAESGVPLTDIQTLLGHQRPTTTDIYLQSIRPSLKEAMKNLEKG